MPHAPFDPGYMNGTSRRVLSVSPPRARLEGVVTGAVERLETDRAKDLKRAEKAIEEFGLTIEATRLRDRHERAALSDLDQLLLSTPGVIESLFLEAIKSELDEAERERGGDGDGNGGGGGNGGGRKPPGTSSKRTTRRTKAPAAAPEAIAVAAEDGEPS